MLFLLATLACSETPEPTPPVAPAAAEADPQGQHDPAMKMHDGAEGMKAPMYACPMHPDQTSNEPADCSECGMHMERMDEGMHDGMDPSTGEAEPSADEHAGHGH